MDTHAALRTFVIECREQLALMESALLGESLPDQEDAVRVLFRSVHTIKGSAGLFGLDSTVAFTHTLESVLDLLRQDRLVLNDELAVLLLSCCDHLGSRITTIATHRGDPKDNPEAMALLLQLQRFLEPPPEPVVAPPPVEAPVEAPPKVLIEVPVPAPQPLQRIQGAEAAPPESPDAHAHWHLSLRFGPDALRQGLDPLAFIRHLGGLGRVVGIATLCDALPDNPEAMDAEACYLGFEIAFASQADKAAIEQVFEFARGHCALRIVPPHSRSAAFVELIQQLPEAPAHLGELLVACGSITERELAAALEAQQEGAKAPLGQILVEQQAVAPAVLKAALAKQTGPGEARSMRVDAARLDQLITLVGELCTAGAGAELLARRHGDVELIDAQERLSALLQQVRDSSLQLRMVRIGSIFGRFRRLVHDTARELGKDIALSLEGADTELDRALVEHIGDPLLHLVRNAIDHGIEPVVERLAQGKPARGQIELRASQEGGSILIEVRDDGRGLQRDRILAKALECGLLRADAQPSEAELNELVFVPGFSTARELTQLSGRGVGMDVVRREIKAVRGSVALASQAGRGTTVSVRLPLTLALIEGLLVRAGGSSFVLPMDMVDECIAFDGGLPGRACCELRGELLPYLRLAEQFELAPAPPGGEVPALASRESAVVLRHAGRRTALVVDALRGELQVVIKPLHKIFGRLRSLSGSTILGNGEVALILDVPALLAELAPLADAPTPQLAGRPPTADQPLELP